MFVNKLYILHSPLMHRFFFVQITRKLVTYDHNQEQMLLICNGLLIFTLITAPLMAAIGWGQKLQDVDLFQVLGCLDRDC